MPPDPKVLADLQNEIASRLVEISNLFKGHPKTTCLVRFPDFPDGSRDVLVTDDDLDGVIAGILIRKGEGS